MKKLMLIFLFVGIFHFLKGQTMFAYNGYFNMHLDQFQNSCPNAVESYCDLLYYMNSVAFNVEGNLYGLVFTNQTGPNVFKRYLVSWDLNSCDTTFLSGGVLKSNTNYNCLFVDYLGRIYFSTRVNQKDGMFRCMTGLESPLLILDYSLGFSNRSFTDMVIIRDRIYGLNLYQNTIYVLDTTFQLIHAFQPDYQLTGLSSTFNSCDSSKIIASGYRISHADFMIRLNFSDSTMRDSMNLFELDPINYNLKFLCYKKVTNIYKDIGFLPESLTSFDDILNSDPECDLLLDLDRNNSSGLYPYNFQLDRMVCNKDLYPICDTDVYLHTNLALDSMQFRLTGIKDIGLEYLIGTNMPVGFLFIQRSDSLYSLIGNANSPDLSFMNAMRSIYYNHTGITNRTDGERVIHIEGYSPIKKGQTVRCSIQVLKLVKTQQDSFICPGTFIQDQMGNKYFEGDTINELKSQGAADCDTIKQIIVKNYNVRQVTIKGDSILCRNTSKQLCVEPYQSYRWSTGEQGPCINIHQAGSYQVCVSDEHACSSTAEFNVSYPMVPNYQIDISNPRCPGERNGELRIQAGSAIKQYQVNGIINTNGNFNKLESGIYQIQLTDQYDCIYLDTVELNEADAIVIYFQDTLQIKDRIAELLRIENNGVELDTIRIEPTQGIEKLREWEFLINPEKGGHYTIIVKDKNGCIKEYQLIIQLQLNQNINAPNAFSPNQDGINELWNISLGSAYRAQSLEIFDRWGVKIYHFNKEEIGKLDAGWDGRFNQKLCNPGVFLYVLEFVDENGTTKRLAGDFTLIR